MANLVMGLAISAMALLFSALIFFIPDRGTRVAPKESFEDSQKRMREHLREMRSNRGEVDS